MHYNNIGGIMQKFIEKSLTAVITKEGKWFVSFNPETGVASQGSTKKAALENLKEAVELFLEDDPISIKAERDVVEFKAKVKVNA